MARIMWKSKNKILLVVLTLLLCVMTVQGVYASILSTVTLEQSPSCGLEEHVHTEDCYVDELLHCGQKAHTHDGNCYAVLLEDNNINQLLNMMEQTENRSLEEVIDENSQVITLNSNLNTLTPAGSGNSGTNLLNGGGVSTLGLGGQTIAAAPSAIGSSTSNNGGVSTLAVGDKPAEGDLAINFYIRLDGKATCIGNATGTGQDNPTVPYNTIIKLYTDVVETKLNSGNLYNWGQSGAYYFRSNKNGSTSNFDRGSWIGNNSVYFEGVDTTYAILSWSNNSTDPVDFYTLTLDYTSNGVKDANEVKYVEENYAYTLPALPSGCYWAYDKAGNNRYNGNTVTLTGATTLYAVPDTCTVTYYNANGGIYRTVSDIEPGTSHTLIAPPANHIWVYDNGDKAPASVTVNNSLSFKAVPANYTVTFIDEENKSESKTVGYRETVTLPDLPDGWYWEASDGIKYAEGVVYGPVEEPVTFRAVSRPITINYDVNFTRTGTGMGAAPTIVGTNSSRTVTDQVSGNTTVRDVTSRKVRQVVNTSTQQSRTHYFRGWGVEGSDEVLIQPGSSISWEQLASYAGDDDVLNLRGIWGSQENRNSVSFYVRLDSRAVDNNTGGVGQQGSENYTPSVFDTFVGFSGTAGDGKGGLRPNYKGNLTNDYGVFDDSEDNSFTADQEIRALWGEKAEGVWLYDFPKDEDVFAYLRTYQNQYGNDSSKRLTVKDDDGQIRVVNIDELDSKHYSIRWYVFKHQDFWHIDGKLVLKKGQIEVTKVFGGTQSVLENAADGFHVVASKGTRNANGEFVPYASTDANYGEYVLLLDKFDNLSSEIKTKLQTNHPKATYLVWDGSADEGEEHTYYWTIPSVEIGEYWKLEEHPGDIEGYKYYAEYSIYDTEGQITAVAEYGTNAHVVGKVFPVDENPDHCLMVDFKNYYYDAQSILIKKEDGATGLPIGGAVFELYQQGNLLTFNNVNGTYERDEQGDGEFSQIETSDDGFSVISTSGFSYEYGDVVVKEVSAPVGYKAAPDITIGLADDNKTVVLKGVDGIAEGEWAEYAEVPNNDVLVVKNNNANKVSVTAEKVWSSGTPTESVEMVLEVIVNGKNQMATTLFPGLQGVQAKLTAATGWKHTWTDLPSYANGQPVVWSVREVKVGDMTTVDGVNFSNWDVTYIPGISSDTDKDGEIDNWHFVVRNDIRSPKLTILKVSETGAFLSGAEFQLEQVELGNGAWHRVNGSLAPVGKTDEYGVLTFNQLDPNAFYRLTEVTAPGGHIACFEGVVLSINGVGEIQQVADDGTLGPVTEPYITVLSASNVQITNNLQNVVLPETGGAGTTWYVQCGVLLILAALALYVYHKRCRREGNFLDV